MNLNTTFPWAEYIVIKPEYIFDWSAEVTAIDKHIQTFILKIQLTKNIDLTAARASDKDSASQLSVSEVWMFTYFSPPPFRFFTVGAFF